MGDVLTGLLLTFIYGIVSNWILFFFLILGAIIGKKKMVFFSIGVIVQGVSVFGSVVTVKANGGLSAER